jgi:hypothetical protein
VAATITDNRVIVDEADATTNWTGSVTISVVTSDPTPVESTGCLGQRNNNTTTDMYRGSLTAIDFTAGNSPGPSLIYVWVFPRTVPDTKTNGGIAIQVGDGTNRVAYHVGGGDESGFRHEIGPTLWQCFVLDTARAQAGAYGSTTKAGSAGSLSWAAITQIGVQFKGVVGAQGNVPNTYLDIMRRAAISVGLTITGTSGVMTDIVTADSAIGSQQAFGVVRQLATGVYGVQGVLRFGDGSGSANTSFSIVNETVVFPGFTVGTDKYQIIVQQGGSGTTTMVISGSTLYCPVGIGARFDAGGSGTIDLTVSATTFFGFSQGVLFKGGHSVTNTIFSNCGQITAPGTELTGCTVLGYEGTANTSALIWDANVDTDGQLDDMSFTKGTAATHAIELGTTSPTDVTLRSVSFSGYNAANGENDSTIHVKRTSGTVTINLVGCSGNISYRSDGATVNFVTNPVTLLLTAVDSADSTPVQGAIVLVLAGTNFLGGTSVTISRSGSTATVAHTAHGFATGNEVRIRGADQTEYNGLYTITVTGANEYTYTVAGTPATPATGSIVSALVIIDATTDVDGEVSATRSWSSSQAFVGRVRRGSTSPVYKPQPVAGIIDNVTGATATAPLVADG